MNCDKDWCVRQQRGIRLSQGWSGRFPEKPPLHLSYQQLAALEQLEPLTHLPLSLLSQLPCCKNFSITAILIIGPFLEGHLPSKAGDPSTKRLRMNHSVSREFLDEDKKFGIAAKTLADRRTGWTGSEQPQAAALSRIWSVRALAEAKTHHKPF